MHGAQRGLQIGLQLRARLGRRQGIHVAHHREEVGILHAQEIVPEKVADAEEPGQRIQHLLPFQRCQLVRPVWPLEEIRDKLAKVKQRRFGVR